MWNWKTYEKTVKRLRIVRGRERAGGLHMSFEVPELHQPDVADVDDVARGRNGRFRVRAVRHGVAEWNDEFRHILIQPAKHSELSWDGVRRGRGGRVFDDRGRLLERSHVVFDVRDLVDVDRVPS